MDKVQQLNFLGPPCSVNISKGRSNFCAKVGGQADSYTITALSRYSYLHNGP